MSNAAESSSQLESVPVGQVLSRSSVQISRADLVDYANASGDQNPIHQDAEVARSVGLPDVIAHGMLTMGLVGSAVETIAEGRAIVSFGTRFAAPVVVSEDAGVQVEMELLLLARDEQARTVTVDATVSVAGTKVLSRTRAVIQFD